ncbi:hypothetical protein FRC09_001194 [Ceratobasidium sp. 395]|nr:hypothetical protein FRC09_001194 [Ceratobasidium sp. 395]
MSTGPGFARPTSSSSNRAASDNELQPDCDRVREPQTPRKNSLRTPSRPATPERRPTTPSRRPSAVPIPSRRNTHTRTPSNSSLKNVVTPGPPRFSLPPVAGSPATTSTFTASAQPRSSSPDSILDHSILHHSEPEEMSTSVTQTQSDKDKPEQALKLNEKAQKQEISSGSQAEAKQGDPVKAGKAQPQGPTANINQPNGDQESPEPEPENKKEQAKKDVVSAPVVAPGTDSASKPDSDGDKKSNPGATDQGGTASPEKTDRSKVNPKPEDAQQPAVSPQSAQPNGNTEAPITTTPDGKPATEQPSTAPDPSAATSQPASTAPPPPAPQASGTDTKPGEGTTTAATGGATTTTPQTTVPAVPAIPGVITLLSFDVADTLNDPKTDVGRINAVWNKWFNALAGPNVYVEPAAHRYNINDEMVPDIVIYPLATTGQDNKWSIVYEGRPGVDALPPGVPSQQNWDSFATHMEYICSRHKDQSPKWAVLAIGRYARIFKFVSGKLQAQMFQTPSFVMVPVPPTGYPGPDPNLDPQQLTYVNLNVAEDPKAPAGYIGVFNVVLPQLFLPSLPSLP